MRKIMYNRYENWERDVKAMRLMLVGCSNGLVAQDGPRGRGTCRGFWGWTTNRGWIEMKIVSIEEARASRKQGARKLSGGSR